MYKCIWSLCTNISHTIAERCVCASDERHPLSNKENKQSIFWSKSIRCMQHILIIMGSILRRRRRYDFVQQARLEIDSDEMWKIWLYRLECHFCLCDTALFQYMYLIRKNNQSRFLCKRNKINIHTTFSVTLKIIFFWSFMPFPYDFDCSNFRKFLQKNYAFQQIKIYNYAVQWHCLKVFSIFLLSFCCIILLLIHSSFCLSA